MPLFTRREEELQKLLAEERKRSEQRRNNYNSLKGEHLKLQDQYLNLQAEMKQILEETVYFKEKKKEKRLSSKLTLDYIGNCTGLLLCTVLCCFTLDPSGIFTSHNYKGNTTTKFKQKQATN